MKCHEVSWSVQDVSVNLEPMWLVAVWIMADGRNRSWRSKRASGLCSQCCSLGVGVWLDSMEPMESFMELKLQSLDLTTFCLCFTISAALFGSEKGWSGVDMSWCHWCIVLTQQISEDLAATTIPLLWIYDSTLYYYHIHVLCIMIFVSICVFSFSSPNNAYGVFQSRTLSLQTTTQTLFGLGAMQNCGHSTWLMARHPRVARATLAFLLVW